MCVWGGGGGGVGHPFLSSSDQQEKMVQPTLMSGQERKTKSVIVF